MPSDCRIAVELRNKIISFNNYIKYNTKGNSSDIEKIKNMIYAYSKDCARLSRYMITIFKHDGHLSSIASQIYSLVNDINCNILNTNTMEEIRSLVEEFAEEEIQGRFDNRLRYDYSAYYDATDLFNDIKDKGNIYTTDDFILNEIANSICSQKDLTLLSLECKNGNDESKIATRISSNNDINTRTYGISIPEYGSNEAKTKMDRVVLGAIKGSTITNNAFDIVYCAPYISVITELNMNNKLKPSNEEAMAEASLRYLKPNGLLIYTIPLYCLNNNIKIILSKKLKNITVFKHISNNLDKQAVQFITIMGIKGTEVSYSENFSFLSNINYNKLKGEPYKTYTLDLLDVEIKMFRGSQLDKDELNSVINDDGLFDEFYSKIKTQHQNADTRPLLPFNIGQIGLILSSGSLDGIVEENKNVMHVIKGMTIKETTNDTETIMNADGTNTIQSTETIRNRVQISALGADGTFYKLT